ncbi:MAG TPA: hypothetical protein VF376_09325 [Thermoanaerobaculia bacterium]
MAHAEFGICRSRGVRHRKESELDLILMAIGVAIFLLAFALFTRASRGGDSSLSLPIALAALAGLVLAGWETFRLWRRKDDAALMQAGTLGFISLIGIHEKAPKGSALALAAALAPLLPAALFAWSTVRLARQADELQRRIAQEALAFGFVVALFAALTGMALEAAGLPRLDWAWMAAVLVVACGVGFLLANRRYR